MGKSIDDDFCKGCGCELTVRYRGFFCDSACRRVYVRRSLAEAAKKPKKSEAKSAEQLSFGAWASKASKRGIPWVLEFHDFMKMWQKPCWYCGGAIATIGIDRKDSSIGYRVGNCVPCCGSCNQAKLAMGVAEFVGMCARVARHWPGDFADGSIPDIGRLDAESRARAQKSMKKKKRRKGAKRVKVLIERLDTGGIQMRLF